MPTLWGKDTFFLWTFYELSDVVAACHNLLRQNERAPGQLLISAILHCFYVDNLNLTSCLVILEQNRLEVGMKNY